MRLIKKVKNITIMPPPPFVTLLLQSDKLCEPLDGTVGQTFSALKKMISILTLSRILNFVTHFKVTIEYIIYTVIWVPSPPYAGVTKILGVGTAPSARSSPNFSNTATTTQNNTTQLSAGAPPTFVQVIPVNTWYAVQLV